mgnify:CR=1 FL=1
MTVVLCGLIDGRPREEVLDRDWHPIRQVREITPFHPEIAGETRVHEMMLELIDEER